MGTPTATPPSALGPGSVLVNVLCILARVPSPGVGKSRLRAQLGDRVTDRLAQAFVGDVLNWPVESADEVVVAHDGPPSLLPAGRWVALPQVTGDLGNRIAGAIDGCFDRGAGRVVIVGTDCPTLPAVLLDAAFGGLSQVSSTLVPAADGGWIALGVDRRLGGALTDVVWSSSRAGEQTIACLRADGRPPRVLPEWYDIDEPADLARLRTDPGGHLRAPRTYAALHDIDANAP